MQGEVLKQFYLWWHESVFFYSHKAPLSKKKKKKIITLAQSCEESNTKNDKNSNLVLSFQQS